MKLQRLVVAMVSFGAAVAVAQDGGTHAQHGGGKPGAEAEQVQGRFVDATGAQIGTVTLTQHPGGVLVHARFDKLPPGAHAFHLHTTGKCEGNFDSAGGHFNPTGKKHGFAGEPGMHAGDLANLHVQTAGAYEVEQFAAGLKLRGGQGAVLDADGAAVMVHEKADDYRSDPAGAAGARIACAAVTDSAAAAPPGKGGARKK